MYPQSTHPEPYPVQLALQGGGAKICTLLAAVEAIQLLERDRIIKVKRIAGTSAGALVGCLFAAGVDMNLMRRHLQRYNQKQLARLFPPPSALRLLRLVKSGHPLWETDPLVKELEPIFREKGVYTLGDTIKKTGVEVIVVASNLAESSKIVYREPDKSIIQAILDSCGLPYCFRVWNRDDSPVIVDGGICDNLPSEELEPFQDEDGPVLGISFTPTSTKSPNNLKEFTVALLNTAINNSMKRAKRRLGSDRVFCIDTNIGTFDFSKAVKEGLEAQYDLIKEQAKNFFTNFVQTRSDQSQTEIVSSEAWKEQNVSMMERLFHVYKTQHLPTKLIYKRCSLIVQANCMVTDPLSNFFQAPDFVSYSLQFETGDSPIYCHGFSLSESQHKSAPTETELSLWNNKTNETHEIISLPMRDSSRPTKKQLFLSFIPVLPPNSGPYTLRCKDVVYDFMSGLKSAKKDELKLTPLRVAGAVEKIDLVVFLPKALQQATMYAKPGSPGGKEMTPAELGRLYEPPPGFRALGWSGEGIAPMTQFGVDIVV